MSRFWRSAKNQKAGPAGVLEAIAQFRVAGEDGRPPARVKIVMRKEDLKQVLEAIRNGRSAVKGGPPPAPAFEERLINLMRRRQQILRTAGQAKGRGRLGAWKPVLHSIPEEI
ncbi:ubiquitin-conjugating enzyme 22 [Striga asiatica]|uniref:Ubiquitin-conjugating enzyme 22 n=1 Tax=Striga asiatica TaxID=4170 RepID=A0A5A7PNX6_STRAF|nr:ubiquitin-conjugating enzyme 22 [Striga asiatica]